MYGFDYEETQATADSTADKCVSMCLVRDVLAPSMTASRWSRQTRDHWRHVTHRIETSDRQGDVVRLYEELYVSVYESDASSLAVHEQSRTVDAHIIVQ